MAGYCPRSFFASLRTSTSSRPINTQKKLGQYPAILTEQAWSITLYLAPGRLFTFGSAGEGGFFFGQGAYFILEKQPNVENKTSIWCEDIQETAAS